MSDEFLFYNSNITETVELKKLDTFLKFEKYVHFRYQHLNLT